MADDDAPKADTPKLDKAAVATKWLAAIARAEKDLATYWQRCDKINKIYTEARKSSSETAASTKRQFSILWANQCVLQPAVYARTPAPVVQRRYRDRDPVAREVCNIQERALEYNFEAVNLDETLRAVRDDFLLFARGTAWVRYEPKIEQQPDPEGGEEPIDALVGESVPVDHVHYRDFIYPKVRTWVELPWIARRVFMTRREVAKRFGKDIAAKISLDAKPEGADSDDGSDNGGANKATIHEIWSKVDNKCIWVSPGFPETLDYADPHLTLKGFFPCPKPAFGTLPTNSLIPVPDYVYYQDQAEEIDDLTARIAEVSDQLELKGFYPAGPSQEGAEAIEIVVKPGQGGKLIPIPSWAAFAEKGGVNQIQFWPVDMAIKVIEGCVALRKQLIDDVYQITGISDIVRGDTDPRETKGAQQLKSQWGSIRIRDRQVEIARFARDLACIMGEIIADKFQPETLMQMTGISLPSDDEVQQQYAQELAQWRQAATEAMMAQQQAPPPQAPPGPPQGAPPGMGMAA